MEKYMKEALKEAMLAKEKDEVPIGAVVVKAGQIIGRGHNLTITNKDPRAHAEMIAIDDALLNNEGFRLVGCEMYVTVEPCSMCAGAIVLSRLDRLIIGTMDSKAGAAGSVFNIVEEPKLNHRVEVIRGILKEDCELVIKNFFKMIRDNRRIKE